MDKSKKNKKSGRPQAKRDESSEKQMKNQKKRLQDSEDDLTSEDETPVFIPTQNKKKQISAFAMLQDEDDDNDNSMESEVSEPEQKPVEQKKPVVQQNQKNIKKQQPIKGGKKKEEGDDIDAILASISGGQAKPQPTADKKSKKNKKGSKDVDEIFEELKRKEQNGDAQHEEQQQPQQQKQIPEIRPDMTADELAEIFEQTYMDDEDEEDNKRKKKNKQQQKKAEQKPKEVKGDVESGDDDDDNDEEAGSTVKTNAQKKKEKKERQKAEKLKNTQQTKAKPAAQEKAKKEEPAAKEVEREETPASEKPDAEEGQQSKKDKKKKKGEAEKEEKPKKSNKMANMIKEMQKRREEEEERLRQAEEERIRKEEEERRLQEQKEEEERLRKERKKQKEKERIKRKKAEGTFKTDKQKDYEKRALQMLEVYRAQGVDVPLVGAKNEAPEAVVPEKPKRVIYASKPKKKTQQQQSQTSSTASPTETPTEAEMLKIESEPQKEEVEEEEEEEEEVKDNWDDSEGEEDNVSQVSSTADAQNEVPRTEASAAHKQKVSESSKEPEEEDEEEEEDDDDEEEDEDESSSEEEEDERTPREKAIAAIEKRKQASEAAKSADNLRAPVICVLGHVDTGKTKILDKLRRTHVQDGEAGGITQQIGATNVPHSALKDQTKMCKEFDLKIPGLLIIDTPGHESFSNLRTRGSSLCDLAVLVVDIMHGIEAQTRESIEILRNRKTPFVVALNKIDRLFGWQTNPHSDIVNLLKKQKQNVKIEFDTRVKKVVSEFAELGLNACLFNENKNQREYISLVPTSAITGDGMGNLISLVCELTQTFMVKRLMYSNELQATVMEVKTIAGLGTTVDVILINGKLCVGNTIIVAGQEGPIVTQIRSLLLPPPMHEIRVKNNFESHKEVVAAQGCKVAGKDLEKAIAGLPMFVAHDNEEAEVYKEELSQMLKDFLSEIKVSEKGVYVQASTLGSLEALLKFLKDSSIPYSGINIGPVHKKDVVRTMAMLEHDPHLACILAFDVKVEREAQEMADNHGVQVFQADIIYHLFDNFMAYRERYKKQKQEEFKHVAMFPCKIRILPNYVFNSRDPIVVGVVIEDGFVKEGTVLCVPSKNFIDVGRVSSIEINHKQVDRATKGQEVCLKIDAIPGETPKLYGRHFDCTDLLVSKISRQSIDAVKNWFRDDMSAADWKLIVELKRTFSII